MFRPAVDEEYRVATMYCLDDRVDDIRVMFRIGGGAAAREANSSSETLPLSQSCERPLRTGPRRAEVLRNWMTSAPQLLEYRAFTHPWSPLTRSRRTRRATSEASCGDLRSSPRPDRASNPKVGRPPEPWAYLNEHGQVEQIGTR